jgi:N-methylhydantoinase A
MIGALAVRAALAGNVAFGLVWVRSHVRVAPLPHALPNAMNGVTLGLDIGGTFTDVVMADPATGRLWTAKTPSTPTDPSEGFFTGVDKVLAGGQQAPADVASVFHGSTVATNAILEGKGARTGLITTAGFKYVLEIGRHEIPRKEHLYAWVKPKRPVPPRLIREVPERVLLDGSVQQPLDEAACRDAALALAALDVQAIAIVFVHAYANPAHEQRAAEIVRAAFPGAHVTISSDVLPVFREYERAMTTVLNAYVQPLVSRYVDSLASGLLARGIRAPLYVMKSNGGVFGPRQASRQPVNMALSGPAAGAIGASHVAALSGFANAITIDIGGTSADVSLIRDGAAQLSTEGQVGDFPMALPIVDIHTIGAGGGSLARVVEGGGLAVGPESAGAAPGPACYARGGSLPTVTDANLVLGRIPPHLLDGEIPIDAELATRAIHDHIARPLGIDVLAAAEGIVRLLDNNMVGALKVVSVEKGYDPREFSLVAFGGAGPLHAGELARLLGTSTVIVPPHPGLLCALGLLASDVTYDYARTCLQRAPDYDVARMEQLLRELESAAQQDFDREGVAPQRRSTARLADLRYHRQGFELTVELPDAPLDAATAHAAIESFHRLHEQLYTFADRSAAVEFVTLRLRAVGSMPRVTLAEMPGVAAGTPAPVADERAVYFAHSGFVPTPIYRREALLAGHHIAGPAVIEQLDTTTVIFPGQAAQVDAHGNLIVRLDAKRR